MFNDRLKKESHDNLEALKTIAKEKGFENVEVVSARGEPAKISY